ncbi:hypothetical protein Bca52824_071317 [Brassica carinata]|uniref:Uncharacterized protein n=1 Tax=Brassica carinata TaxID=52824 RepID=A0A8X7Q746_BRACI|nr:hypothetical protein Bca52824_071317 [Brassica carinata]
MPEDSTSIDYVMEKASGPHFSGLRLDGLLFPVQILQLFSFSLPLRRLIVLLIPDPAAPNQPFVIGDSSLLPPRALILAYRVTGGTASGKTTVCDMIIQQLHDHRIVLVNQDSFYRGLTSEELARVQEYNFDHPVYMLLSNLLKHTNHNNPLQEMKEQNKQGLHGGLVH